MTHIEERLREDLKRLSERAQPDSIRPLRDPSPRGRSRAVRWLAPVAAVTAVIGVIAGVSLVSHSTSRQSASHERPGRMPPYYVVVRCCNNDKHWTTTATVRDSRTGTQLTSVLLPTLQPIGSLAISGAADGRTFLIDDGNRLFLLRLAADGRSALLRRLPIAVPDLSTPTLSPDGSQVAFANQPSCGATFHVNGCRDNMIRIVSLATGVTRTWSTRAPWEPGMWISWHGNDHVLFSWASASSPHQSGYRLLDTSAGGGDLLASRALPLPPLAVLGGFAYPQSAFITPDAKAVIASAFSVVPSGKSTTVIMRILALSARTGRVVRVLLEASMDQYDQLFLFKGEGCSVLGLGPGGVHALVECTSTRTIFGRVDNGRFTPLPGIPYLGGIDFVDAAW